MEGAFHMTFDYNTNGVCSQRIQIEIENDLIKKVVFIGGCNGNLKGIGNLLVGMEPEEAISRLSGIKCGTRATSCPDQLAKALATVESNKKSQA